MTEAELKSRYGHYLDEVELQLTRAINQVSSTNQRNDEVQPRDKQVHFYSDSLKEEGHFLSYFTSIDHLLPQKSHLINYLEIGSNKGASLSTVGLILKDAGRLGTLVSIDPYFKDGYLEGNRKIPITKSTRDIALQLYFNCGLDVNLLEVPSERGLSALIKEDGTKFDLIFIDGAHTGLAPMVDFSLCTLLIKPEGLIIMDDINVGAFPEISSVVSYAKRHLKCIYENSRSCIFKWHTGH